MASTNLEQAGRTNPAGPAWRQNLSNSKPISSSASPRPAGRNGWMTICNTSDYISNFPNACVINYHDTVAFG
ncbi:MAG TPA: hypothetical protein VGY98_07235 [Verrucomicrobiae bacterium]|nr:hypothetical protein [Verrucomicrobiae bacterium]